MSKQPKSPSADRRLLAEALAVPVDDALLLRALTHRSYAYENGGLPTNERLEFLGDAVLGLVVTDALYRGNPEMPEGQLAKLRASVVNMRALAAVARGIGEKGLGPFVLLGRGEEATGGREKHSILADTLEALLGAVYETAGIEAATVLVRRLFDPLIESSTQRGAGLDWKTSLQELVASRLLGPVEYLVAESGPDHAKRFRATLVLDGVEFGVGEGGSKKEAEQLAAAQAVQTLNSGIEVSGGDGLGSRDRLGAEDRLGSGDGLSSADDAAPVGTADSDTTTGS